MSADLDIVSDILKKSSLLHKDCFFKTCSKMKSFSQENEGILGTEGRLYKCEMCTLHSDTRVSLWIFFSSTCE